MSGNAIQRVLSAAVVGGAGLFFVFAGSGLEVGTARSMGPGYFPLLLGYLLVLNGILIALLDRDNIDTAPAIRPLAAVLAAILVFAVTVQPFGLAPALVLCVLAAAAGDRASRPLSALAIGIGIVVFAWLVFRVGLGIRIPVVTWPW